MYMINNGHEVPNSEMLIKIHRCLMLGSHRERRRWRREEMHAPTKKILCCVKLGWILSWICYVERSKMAQKWEKSIVTSMNTSTACNRIQSQVNGVRALSLIYGLPSKSRWTFFVVRMLGWWIGMKVIRVGSHVSSVCSTLINIFLLASFLMIYWHFFYSLAWPAYCTIKLIRSHSLCRIVGWSWAGNPSGLPSLKISRTLPTEKKEKKEKISRTPTRRRKTMKDMKEEKERYKLYLDFQGRGVWEKLVIEREMIEMEKMTPCDHMKLEKTKTMESI